MRLKNLLSMKVRLIAVAPLERIAAGIDEAIFSSTFFRGITGESDPDFFVPHFKINLEHREGLLLMKFMATLLLILILGLPQNVTCQSHRLEFPVEGNQLPYDLTPVGEHGFLLMELDGIPLSQEVTQFNFIHYNSDFDLSFNFPIQVNRNLLLVAKEFSGDQAVFVFQNPRFNRLQVTRIIIPQKMVNTTLVELTPNIEVLDLEAWDDKAWISASLNNQAILFEVDLVENKKRTLPTGIGFPVITIHDVQYNSDRAELSYLMGLTINKRKVYAVRTLNSNGKVVNDLVLGQDANVNFLSGQLRYSEEKLIIVGLYNSNQSDIPKGVALIQAQFEGEPDLEFYPFKDLPQFFTSYTADQESISAFNGDLTKLRKTKNSASNLLFRMDNLLVNPERLLMSLDVYSKTYRSRNEEEASNVLDVVLAARTEQTLSGFVVDRTGTPVEGATILYGKAGDPNRSLAVSGPTGTFSLSVPAEQEYSSAQNNLGVMYEKGQGVRQDYVQAHMWFNLAATRGHKMALKNRDIIAKRMTPADISKAQRLAREWWAKHGKK